MLSEVSTLLNVGQTWAIIRYDLEALLEADLRFVEFAFGVNSPSGFKLLHKLGLRFIEVALLTK